MDPRALARCPKTEKKTSSKYAQKKQIVLTLRSQHKIVMLQTKFPNTFLVWKFCLDQNFIDIHA